MTVSYLKLLRIYVLSVIVGCSQGQLTSICVQTVSDIIKNLHQIPSQHGLPIKQTTAPLLIFKRRFRDVSSQQRYLSRLVKAYQSERVKTRLRWRRKRDTVNGILAECVKTVCTEKRNDPTKVEG
uniref:ADM n=2 Tax=Bursaphelenchus xylophilus TaxID=6326 RepID=A0A1I7RNK6_BURXY